MYQKIHEDYQLFKIMEQKFLNYCSDEIEKCKTNKAMVNAIKKSMNKFFFTKRIILIAKENNISYHKALSKDFKKRKRQNYKDKNFHKSMFYEYIYEIKLILLKISKKYNWNPNQQTFSKLIIKPTIPKNPNRKFNEIFVKKIADMFYIRKEFVKNRINIFYEVNKENNLISYKSVCRIINNDDRNLNKLKIENTIKHPLRTWTTDIGKIQMDVKVYGYTETKFKQNIYILDAKDEQSKIYWSKLLITQSKDEILDGLNECIEFYKKHGIKIKRIRTDNAMVFKKTNVVKSGEFDKICSLNNIEHQFIPKKQPQSNGCIERHHQILDKEFLPCIDDCSTINEISEKLQKYTYYFNNQRCHIYNDIKQFTNDFIYIPMEYLKKCKNKLIN